MAEDASKYAEMQKEIWSLRTQLALATKSKESEEENSALRDLSRASVEVVPESTTKLRALGNTELGGEVLYRLYQRYRLFPRP